MDDTPETWSFIHLRADYLEKTRHKENKLHFHQWTNGQNL